VKQQPQASLPQFLRILFLVLLCVGGMNCVVDADAGFPGRRTAPSLGAEPPARSPEQGMPASKLGDQRPSVRLRRSRAPLRLRNGKLFRPTARTTAGAAGVSGFAADELFFEGEDAWQDGYYFRDDLPGGRLNFDIEVGRVLFRDKSRAGDRSRVIAPGTPIQLVLKVWDVDYDRGEVDVVYFNGQPIGTLTGANDSWSTCIFTIPPDLLDDARFQGLQNDPEAVQNAVSIDVDVAGEGWAVEVDWGQIQLHALRPIAFFHGILSSSGAWDTMRAQVPANNSEAFELGPKSSTEANGTVVTRSLQQLTRSFGVSKVNVVAHSKGGLDTFESLRTSATLVDQFITLASPLKGTEMADHIGDQHPSLTSVLGGAQIAAALRTTTRDAYYTQHGTSAPPGVRYSCAMGTPFAHDFTRCPLNWLDSGPAARPFTVLGATGGQNDQYVPLARSLPPFRSAVDRVFPPLAHTAINQSRDVWNWIYSVLINGTTSGSSSVSARASRASRPRVTPSRATAVVSTIPPQLATITGNVSAGAVTLSTLPVDPTITALRLLLTYPSDGGATLELALLDPSGNRLDAGNLGSSFARGNAAPGLAYVGIKVNAPAVGAWKAEIRGVTAGSFTLVTQLTSSLGMSLQAPQGETPQGAPVTLTSSLIGGAPSGVSVSGQLRNLTSDTSSMLSFTAAGGKFQSTLTNLQAGDYVAIAQASGSQGGSPFQRECQVAFRVFPRSATLVRMDGETPIDLDGDSLYDLVRVALRWTAAQAGTYTLSAALTSSGGVALATAGRTVSVNAPGEFVTQLDFDGSLLRQAHVDGPYLLTDARIQDVGAGSLTSDARYGFAQTRAYSASEFEGPLLELTGNGSVEEVDANMDGRIDRLRFHIIVNVQEAAAGFFSWNAQLQAQDGTGINYSATIAEPLAGGLNNVTFEYLAQDIVASGRSGPLHLGSFYLYNEANDELQLQSPLAWITRAYSQKEFAGGSNIPAEPSSLTAEALSNAAIQLAWVDNTGGVASFEIERAEAGGTFGSAASVPAGTTSYLDSGLELNSTYWYRIRALDPGGASAFGRQVAATTLSVAAPVSMPGAVVSAVTQTSITLTWSAPPGADRVDIERSEANGAYVVVEVINDGTTSFTDYGLTPDTEYRYRLRAANSGGYSPYTAPLFARTAAAPPEAPDSVTAVATGRTVHLTWQHPLAGATFELERREGTGTFALLASAAGGARSYDDSVASNRLYSYRLRAVSTAGTSGYSPVVSVVTDVATGGKISAPKSVSFGTVHVGTTKTKKVVIRNTSTTASLDVRLTGMTAPYTLVSGSEYLTLAPRGQVTLLLGCKPTAAGTANRSVQLMSGDARRPLLTMSLKAKGK